MKYYIKALVKVTSKKEYAEDFRQGKLYMNELRYFTKCEQQEMGDKNEARGMTILYDNHQYNFGNSSELCKPIFCLYGLYDTKYGNTSFVSICEKMKHFGDYAVIVTEVGKFLDRLQKSNLEFSPVKYQNVDPRDSDTLVPYNPIYRKLEHFKYQKEFRIVAPNIYLTKHSDEKYDLFSTLEDDHLKTEIVGGLKDITSEVIPVDQLLYPNRYPIHLSVDWEKVETNRCAKYVNPHLNG